MVSKNPRYDFNPERLSFDKIEASKGKKIYKILRFLVLINIIAFGLAYGYNRLPDSLLVRVQEKHISRFRHEYAELQKKTDSLSKELTHRFIPDDERYREVLQMDSLPLDVRYAGTGGSVPTTEQQMTSTDKIFPVLMSKIENFKRQLIVQDESYESILNKSLRRNKRLNHLPGITPVKMNSKIRISSPFGRRIDPFTFLPRFHEGLDFEGPKKTKIYATADGIVTLTRHSRIGYGNEVLINHGYGYVTRYAHLCKILVHENQSVKRGDLIGLMGTTGRSTGTHLHYEVRFHNKALNPKYFFSDDLTPEEFDKLIVKADKQEK